MPTKTKIEWCDYSSNPIEFWYHRPGDEHPKRGWFCVKCATGCKNCYSERMNMRLGFGLEYNAKNSHLVEAVCNTKEINSWQRIPAGSKLFVCDMTDLFGHFIPREFIVRVIQGILAAPQVTFMVLTKRPDAMRAFFSTYYSDCRNGIKNLWVGRSVSTQTDWSSTEMESFLATPAPVHFISAEPMLGYIDILAIHDGIDLVLCGGESGRGARIMYEEWAMYLQSQCETFGIPFFMKQMGSVWAKVNAPKDDPKGANMDYWPAQLRVREFPER